MTLKRPYLKQIMILFLIIIIQGCGDDEPLTPNPFFIENTTPIFRAKVDGVSFNSYAPMAIFDNGVLVVNGISGNTAISFRINNTTIGRYKLNPAGSNVLQYQVENDDPESLLSSFFSASPRGSVELIDINTTKGTISGTFNGRVDHSVLLANANVPDSLIITEGEFFNVPYNNLSAGLSGLGFFEFDADGQRVNFSSGSTNLLDGAVNADTYQYYNFSSATANFNENIIIELDDSRYIEGTTTFFSNEHTDPFSGIADDHLAMASYLVGGLGSNMKEYVSQSGSITINKIETKDGLEHTSGTFNFVGESFDGTQMNISNGQFESVRR